MSRPPDRVELAAGGWARSLASPRLVVIAASAGGLDAIGKVLSSLPAEFPAAIAVVQHRGLDHSELLVALLARRTWLPVRHARDGEPLQAGVVHVCPPGMHMTVEARVRLVEGPRLEFVRPNIDLMLQSVAQVYGPRAVAVVLSGYGSDGAAGCGALVQAGGAVIVQQASTCAAGSMPAAVVRAGVPALALAPERIGLTLQRWVADDSVEPAPVTPPTTVLLVDDHQILRDGLSVLLRAERDIAVVGEAGDGRAGVVLASELAPDVVVMDLAMPDVDGIEATRQIVEHAPRVRVVALSARTDAKSVVETLRAGASGYLSKQSAFSELARAIRAVTSDEFYFSADIEGLAPSGA